MIVFRQGAKLLSFRVSGTPKHTFGNPIISQGFPTGHPEKIRTSESQKLLIDSPLPLGKPERVSETQILGAVFRKDTK